MHVPQKASTWQNPFVQVNVKHPPVLIPQSVACAQSDPVAATQPPLVSQTRFVPHDVPTGSNGLDGTPPVQMFAVHGLLSSGRSSSKGFFVSLPLPSQISSWQSPGVCLVSGVPIAA